LPDVSNGRVGCRWRPATLHGVVFDIFGGALQSGLHGSPRHAAARIISAGANARPHHE
jgi:hypothetical protein